MMRKQPPQVRRAGRAPALLAAMLGMTGVAAPSQAQDSAAACNLQLDPRAITTPKWRSQAVEATDKLMDAARRDQARALLGKALQSMDQGCAQPAENSLAALRALDLGTEASGPQLIMAAISLQAEIMSARGDRDGAEALLLADADKAKAQGALGDERWRRLLLEAAELRGREGVSGFVPSLERAITLYRDILLPALSKTANPSDWWLINVQLSGKYYALGQSKWFQGAADFRASVAAAEESLKSSVAVPNSREWLRSQILLGGALTALGRLPSNEQQSILQRAVDVQKGALAAMNVANQSYEWASVKNVLSSAQMTQAMLLRGPRGLAVLKDAMQSQMDALTIFTRASSPLSWAEGTAGQATIVANMSTFESTRAGAKVHMTRAVALISTALTVFEEQRSVEQVQQAKAMLAQFKAGLAKLQ